MAAALESAKAADLDLHSRWSNEVKGVHKYQGFQRSGRFRMASGAEVAGELSLKGDATTLELFSPSVLPADSAQDIAGTFHDGSKVSLLKCVRRSTVTVRRREGAFHTTTLFPHFALFGDEPLSVTDRRIRRASFVVDDASRIFHDPDAFGTVLDSKAIEEALAKQVVGEKPVELGKWPQVFYFSGKHSIFEVDTVLGNVSAMHGISYRNPGPEGIRVDNSIRMHIAFDAERTADEAINNVLAVMRFLAIVAGRPQNLLELDFSLGDDQERAKLDVFWSMPPRRQADGESEPPSAFDMPLDAGTRPDEFSAVLARWLERDEQWRSARVRFATATAHLNRYNEDRLVGAANMFDIMPPSAYPATVTLPHELQAAKQVAKKAFKGLQQSAERDSLLNALGRIGKPALKHKIRCRVALIVKAAGGVFPKLDLVTDQAVDCRNYFVHGTTGKFDYVRHSELRSFLTDTLEFVFATADLIDAGWDMRAWSRAPTTMSHPFARYRVSYAASLALLEAVLLANSNPPC